MDKILVIGSINMDFVIDVKTIPKIGETVLAHGFQLIPGGKGANQAYAVGKLGGHVAMLGAVGDDEYGKMLCENLRSVNVDISGVKVCKGVNTGTAIICVEDEGDNSIIVNQGANNLVDSALIDEHIELLRNCSIVVMQLEIPLETVEYVAEIAAKLGKTVILDPAPARKDLTAKLLRCVDIMKPNETELQILSSMDGDIEKACASITQQGTKNIIVTLGKEGSYLYSEKNGGKFFPCTQKVKVVDTTAAGDGFTAAVALALARHVTLENAIDFAAKVSAIIVTRKGAQPSIPSADEVC